MLHCVCVCVLCYMWVKSNNVFVKKFIQLTRRSDFEVKASKRAIRKKLLEQNEETWCKMKGFLIQFFITVFTFSLSPSRSHHITSQLINSFLIASFALSTVTFSVCMCPPNPFIARAEASFLLIHHLVFLFFFCAEEYVRKNNRIWEPLRYIITESVFYVF